MPTLRWAVSVWLIAVSLSAAEPVAKVDKAPPLKEVDAADTRDLGTWDDAFQVDDHDFLVLRRGEELFTLPTIGQAEPKAMQSSARLKGTQIIAAAAADDRLWIFLNSREQAPVAFELHSGDVASFDIPGLKVPGEQAPGIQSPVVVPHASAAVLSVSGGDKATWPRDGNRPIYFWMDLKSGKVECFPTGWDMDYFSGDMQTAVFAAVSDDPFQRRPLQAIQMRTGKRLDAAPDRSKELFVPNDWTDRSSARALYARRPGAGDATFFAGLTYRGSALPIDFELKEMFYLAQAKANDDFAAFRLRPEGSGAHEPSPLWLFPTDKPDQRERVADDVVDIAMLQNSNVVFSTSHHGPKRASSEAWYHDHSESATWNVLDGVDRLPPLDKELAAADYIEDRLLIQLEASCGDPKSAPLALCLATHQRGDRRAVVLPMIFEGKAGRGKRLESEVWRRAILLSSNGQRYLTSEFRSGNLPDRFWLHPSGSLVVGTHVWTGEEQDRTRQVQLTQMTFKLPAK